jgi:4'-phosphopantetheinyl transferase EntD
MLDPGFQRDLDDLAPPGLLIGHRVVTPGDEDALLEHEAASIPSSAASVRRASGAARIVARELLAKLGYGPVAIPKAPSGEPVWPEGVAGSMAHDDRIAVAAVGLLRDFRSIGIDIEPAVPLSSDMLELVATPRELRDIARDPLRGKLLFAAKEAVYKAVYPLDRVFLEFGDIEVDLAARRAITRAGRVLAFRYFVSSHVVALALPQADQA